MIPCIGKHTEDLLSITADQRYLLGSEIFLATHYPSTLAHKVTSGAIEPITESDVLKLVLKRNQLSQGNRVFVIFGPPGSGKSELIRWIDIQIRTQSGPKHLRISRTELDPIKILEKVLGHFVDSTLGNQSLERWEEYQNKPVTLANRLVWSSLGRLYTTDEEIIPLSFRLRPLLEENLQTCFNSQKFQQSDTPQTLALLLDEQLEKLRLESSIPEGFDLDKLRYFINKEIESIFLNGQSFPSLFKKIGLEYYRKHQQRPILLIDDLVQSINIFAGDLLDFFVTFEEGNWDLVVGLTPSCFETTANGKHLLQRIEYLDTFSDRLKKLHTIDPEHQVSFTLLQKDCVAFASRYLRQLKALNGYLCGQDCPEFENCVRCTTPFEIDLFPLNSDFVQRLYQALPENRGTIRPFILTLRETLDRISDPAYWANLPCWLGGQFYFSTENPVDQGLATAYSPASMDKSSSIQLQGALKERLGLSPSVEMDVKLLAKNILESTAPHSASRDGSLGLVAWLNRQPTNKERLQGFRVGTAAFLREIGNPLLFVLPHTPRRKGILILEKTIEGTKIPLSIESIDSFEGIPLERKLNETAFDLEHFATLKGKEISKWGESSLEDPRLFKIVMAAEDFSHGKQRDLATILNVSLEDFAFILLRICINIHGFEKRLPAKLGEGFPTGLLGYPKELKSLEISLPEEIRQNIVTLFMDWYELRNNLFDGSRIQQKSEHWPLDACFRVLTSIKTSKIDLSWKIGRYSLKDFIEIIQQEINKFARFRDSEELHFWWKRISILNAIKIGLADPKEKRYLKRLIHILAEKSGAGQLKNLRIIEKYFDFSFEDWEEPDRYAVQDFFETHKKLLLFAEWEQGPHARFVLPIVKILEPLNFEKNKQTIHSLYRIFIRSNNKENISKLLENNKDILQSNFSKEAEEIAGLIFNSMPFISPETRLMALRIREICLTYKKIRSKINKTANLYLKQSKLFESLKTSTEYFSTSQVYKDLREVYLDIELGNKRIYRLGSLISSKNEDLPEEERPSEEKNLIDLIRDAICSRRLIEAQVRQLMRTHHKLNFFEDLTNHLLSLDPPSLPCREELISQLLLWAKELPSDSLSFKVQLAEPEKAARQ